MQYLFVDFKNTHTWLLLYVYAYSRKERKREYCQFSLFIQMVYTYKHILTKYYHLLKYLLDKSSNLLCEPVNNSSSLLYLIFSYMIMNFVQYIRMIFNNWLSTYPFDLHDLLTSFRHLLLMHVPVCFW